jgi:hypothetical protein
MQVAATKTPARPQEVADALVAAWPNQLGGSPTLPQVCVLLAQAALETAEFASMIQYDLGNFKWSGVGNYCQFTTTEYVNGKPTTVVASFMAFPDLATGVAYWLRSMWSHWTAAWPSVIAGDPKGFAEGLHNQKPFPYYTAPVEAYAAGVKRYFDKYITAISLNGTPTDPDNEDSIDP